MSEGIVARLENSIEPSIRYSLLTGFKGVALSDPIVQDLRLQIVACDRVQKMLSARGPDGKFPWHAYSKWRGAFWTLLMLTELGYPPGDASLQPLLDHVMEWLLDPARLKRVPQIDGRYRRCALQESNAVYTSLKLGLKDTRIEQLIELLLKWQWPDGGWNCDKKPAASHSSFNETLIPLKAMGAYAAVAGDPRAIKARDTAAEVFLQRRLFRRKTNDAVICEPFTQIAFPPYWHYDILAALQTMAEIGRLDDPRCAEALDLLESKRMADGGFPSEVKYYKVTERDISGVSNVDWGPVGTKKSNDWVTVRAISVLHQAGRM